MMTKFDFYMVRRLLAGYLGVLFGVIVFFIVLHYVEFIDDFMDRNATIWDVVTIYYPYSIPEIVQLGSPLAIFLAAILVTGRSAQNLEIASLQTNGVSLYRLLIPFVDFGILITIFMFWFNGWMVPVTNRVKIAFEQEYTKSPSGQVEYSNIHRRNPPGSVLSVGYFERTNNVGTNISLQTFDENLRMVKRIDAERMTWIDSTGSWSLLEPEVRTFAEDGTVSRVSFALLDTVLAILPRDLSRTEADVEAMTITEANEYLDYLERSGADRLGHPYVSYYNKFAYPFSNLILILLAVPIASRRQRGGQAIRLGIGLSIAFVYLATMKLLQPFGYSGALTPVVATWLPHALFGVIAIVVLLRTRT